MEKQKKYNIYVGLLKSDMKTTLNKEEVVNKIMNADKKMPDEFYDWLENCPVQWFRKKVETNAIQYEFLVDDDEKETD